MITGQNTGTGSLEEIAKGSRKGAQVLIDILNEYGVDIVFGHTGGAVIPAHAEINRRLEIGKKAPKFILCGQEGGAGHAAEGYAAASGKTAVVLVTSGPGATNLVTAIADAYADSRPVVFITGQVTNKLLGKDAFQEVDITGVTTPITKHNCLIRNADELGYNLRQAFYIASTGRKGPVVVDICKNAFEEKTKKGDEIRVGPISKKDFKSINDLTKQVLKFIEEYKGIRTTTIQSAFRYDFDKADVKTAIAKLNKLLPLKNADEIPIKDAKILQELIPCFEKPYREVIEKVYLTVNKIASYFPKRRERVQHIGLYGYSRGVGKVKLPRAITFNGAFYSLGIPPELIATGRGLKKAKELGGLNLIKKYYKFIKEDLIEAGKYLNKENLINLSIKSKIWKKVLEDVLSIEEIFNISLGPKTADEIKHAKIVKKIILLLNQGKNPQKEIEQAAILRHSLG